MPRLQSGVLLLVASTACLREPYVSRTALEIFVHATASNSTSVERAIAQGRSILLVSDFLSDAEREELMSAAAAYDSGKPKSRLLALLNAEVVTRIHIALQLAEPARRRGLTILHRTLAYIEQSWPELAALIFGSSKVRRSA